MALYRRILEFLKPYWKKLVIAMICMAFVSASSALYAYLVKNVIDDIFIKKDITMLVLMPIVVIILFFVKGFFFFVQDYRMVRLPKEVSQTYVIWSLRASKNSLSHFLIKPRQARVSRGL